MSLEDSDKQVIMMEEEDNSIPANDNDDNNNNIELQEEERVNFNPKVTVRLFPRIAYGSCSIPSNSGVALGLDWDCIETIETKLHSDDHVSKRYPITQNNNPNEKLLKLTPQQRANAVEEYGFAEEKEHEDDNENIRKSRKGNFCKCPSGENSCSVFGCPCYDSESGCHIEGPGQCGCGITCQNKYGKYIYDWHKIGFQRSIMLSKMREEARNETE